MGKCIKGADDKPVTQPDDKGIVLNSGLSGKAQVKQSEAIDLLKSRGVHKYVAFSLVLDSGHSLEEIQEVIKNGLAKQKHESGFVLNAGYIVEALNTAKREGRVIGPSRNSRRLQKHINNKSRSTNLSPAEFENRKQHCLAQLSGT